MKNNKNKDDKKLNCWDFFDCGREVTSKNRKDSICNASLISSKNGINGGNNAGRQCWNIEGSYCETSFINQTGRSRGTVKHKEEYCSKCEFHDLVRKEEGKNYVD